MYKYIEIKGAKENNLKNISVKIPKNKLVAVTGPSGSGKSTFAMDILQRECQRQYMESMGMITDGFNKPNVDSIIGLSPSISISQGINNRNPRSTVGTFTEILTYIRVFFAKYGYRKCPECNETIMPDFETSNIDESNNDFDSEKYVVCKYCRAKLPRLTMAHFSFNKPEGFCSTCSGLGVVNTIDLSSILDKDLTVGEGAFKFWEGIFAEHYSKVLENAAKHYDFEFDVKKPVKDFNELESLVFYHGVESKEFKKLFPNKKPPKTVNAGKFEGVMTFMKKKAAENINKGITNKKIKACFKDNICPDCHGTRLNESSRKVYINNKSIVEVSSYTLEELYNWITNLEHNLLQSGKLILDALINDIKKRIKGVINIGLGYLSIDRAIRTLSGGEAQRLRLANLTESGLTGVLYVLDEPTTGLHPRDTIKLLQALKHLRDLGNTVLVIEHDIDFINKCDYIIDFGPFSGNNGGEIVAVGTPEQVVKDKKSITGKYLNKENRKLNKSYLGETNKISIVNAYEHNLKNVSIDIPLNRLVTFTGVSGSGKSSLLFDVFAKYTNGEEVKCDNITGLSDIERIIKVNQSQIGKISRSNVATYTDIFTSIREIYSKLPEAKNKKLRSKDFSFNVKGGRCEKCQGLGVIPLDMHFLDDIEVPCPVCKGKRFNREVLEVKFDGNSISDILNKTVKENIEVFKNQKKIYNRLLILSKVGLDYLKLGQSTTTLSGGECQRIKLSKELGKTNGGSTLYLLDEPTTGLHPSDIDKLIKLLKEIINKGNSVIVIEHSLEVIAQSDWIIDLGPEGGTHGGYIIAQGTPTEIINNKVSYTAKFLKQGQA